MQTFFDQLIEQLIGLNLPLNQTHMVFPTRRACVIFKHRFSKHINKPQWLPKTSSIEDFILEISDLEKADDFYLLTTLFEVYKRYDDKILFDEFYSWGKILLADFDETDNYLIDQNKLYATLQDIANMDNTFGVSDEDWQLIVSFWKSIFNDSPTILRQHFIYNWQLIPKIVNDYKNILLENRKVYRGLAYRKVAENINEQNLNNIVFAGFYALSNAEAFIIEHLLDIEHAYVFWDADDYYLSDSIQEAGFYLRNNKLINNKYKSRSIVISNQQAAILSSNKQINLVGIPLKVGQAKFAGNRLQGLLSTNNFSINNAVIVLPDEQLLTPMLHALPQLSEVNITMGYPVKNTQTYTCLCLFIKCMTSRIKENIHIKADLLLLLNHSFIASYQTKANDILKASTINVVDIAHFPSGNNPVIDLLLKPTDHAYQCFEAVVSLIHLMQTETAQKTGIIEQETSLRLLQQLQQYSEILTNLSYITAKSAWFVLNDIIKSIRIPFEGKATDGLQIMGFLETRVLDFERIIMLSVNENFLPGSKAVGSYIPHSLRKAFGLPTTENQDAIYAYHFYRLLQRATYIDLIYNTEQNISGGGEPSRYLLQIKHELLNKNSNIEFSSNVYTTAIQSAKHHEICIEKSNTIIQKLEKKYLTTHQAFKSFSASSISTYINCPLSFYFKYVAEIEPETDSSEIIDNAQFGTILHESLQHLYSEQKHYTKSDVVILQTKITDSVLFAFNKEMGKTSFEGDAFIKKHIIETLLKKLLMLEVERTPFTVTSTEENILLQLNIKTGLISLTGKIDRIDKDNGLLVIDYKTGKLEDKLFNVSDIDVLFNDPDFKPIFQLYFYSYLLYKLHNNTEIKAAFYHFKNLEKGLRFINGQQTLQQQTFVEFEQQLTQILNNIFDTSTPFSQTKNVAICSTCNYRKICNR